MDKEELKKDINNKSEKENNSDLNNENLENKDQDEKKLSPEEEIESLKDKLARSFAVEVKINKLLFENSTVPSST